MVSSSTTQPKVSIIIPVFNTGTAAVKLALGFARGTYKNLEIILVDDGSMDDSLNLLKEFKRQYDLRRKTSTAKVCAKILVIHQENSGASSARNLGLTKATGEYVCFTDSDDSVQPNYIASLVSALERHDGPNSIDQRIALVGTAIEYHRLHGNKVKNIYTSPSRPQLPGETFTTYILRLFATDGRLHAVNNKIFRLKIIQHFDLHFDTRINFAEDTKFVLDYLKAAHRVKYSCVEFVLDPLYIYNYGTETSVVSLSSLSWGNWQKSFANLSRWAGKNPSRTEKSLLRKIHLRWRLSHALAVARSNQSFSHKCQHVSPVLLLPALVVVKFRR